MERLNSNLQPNILPGKAVIVDCLMMIQQLLNHDCAIAES